MRLSRFETIILAPLPQTDDDEEQVPPFFGHDVFLVGAAVGGWHGAQDAEIDQVPQARRLNALGYAQPFLKFAKATKVAKGVANDQK